MSDTTLGVGLALILGAGAAGVTYLVLSGEGGESAPIVYVQAEEDEARERERILLLGARHRPAPVAVAPQEVDAGDVAAALAVNVGRSFGQPLIEGTTRIAGEAIKTGTINLAAVAHPVEDVAAGGTLGKLEALIPSFDGGLVPSRDAIGGAVTALGVNVSQAFVTAGISLTGLRGASEDEQEAILARTAQQLVQTALGTIPIAGALLSGVVGLLAGTYEGQKVLADVGTALQDAYTFQRELLSGDVKGALGLDSGRRDRLRRLLQAIRETQPSNDLRLLRAQDDAARGAYAGELSGTDLARFDAVLRAESTLNAAELADQARLTQELADRNAANAAATLAANEAQIAAGLFTALDQLRQDYYAAGITLKASRSSARHMLEQSLRERVFSFGTWTTRYKAGAMEALAEFDAETERLVAELAASYQERARALGGVL
jgi:hypothetical protein